MSNVWMLNFYSLTWWKIIRRIKSIWDVKWCGCTGMLYIMLNEIHIYCNQLNCEISFISDCCGLTSCEQCYLFSGATYVHFIWCWTRMHALTCAGSPTTEQKKITKHNEVRIKNVRGFAANSLKHLIMPNCLEDRTHTEAIRKEMHGQLFTGKQHLRKRITKYNVCTILC